MASSEVQVPGFDRLMWPALCAMKQMGGSASHHELLDKVIEITQISEDVQNVAHTTGRESRVGYNLRWAQSYLGKYGALENTARGVWALTPKGRRLKENDIKEVVAAVRKMSQSQRRSGNGATEPAEVTENAGGWKDQLIAALQGMTADGFERLCQRILRESGFLRVEVTGRSGDGGIDGVGVLRVALLSFQVYFQCKKWKGNVRAKEIRDFRGAMVGRTDKGLFITTASYTPDAQKEATRDGAPAIDLIDAEQLCELLKNLKLGVTTKTVEEVSVDVEWFAQI
jgi:restriction system protein